MGAVRGQQMLHKPRPGYLELLLWSRLSIYWRADISRLVLSLTQADWFMAGFLQKTVIYKLHIKY